MRQLQRGGWVVYAVLAFVAVFVILFNGSDQVGFTPVLALSAYLMWWMFQVLVLTFQAGRMGWQEGRLSNSRFYFAEIMRRVLPVYGVVLALLVVDSIFGTRLGANIVTFLLSIVAALYLLRRDNNRRAASSLLRGGRANTTSQQERGPKPSQGRGGGRYDRIKGERDARGDIGDELPDADRPHTAGPWSAGEAHDAAQPEPRTSPKDNRRGGKYGHLLDADQDDRA